jgi:5-methylcytosine-specific restriction endonuclease McrA
MEINNTWYKGFFSFFGKGQDNKFENRRDFLYDNRELFGKLIECDQQRLFTSVQKQIKYIEQNKMCIGLDGNECQYHGTNMISITDMEGDHIIEHTNGGRTNIDNLQMLCVDCHVEKTKQFNTKEIIQ